MEYTDELTSDGVMCIPTLMTIGSGIKVIKTKTKLRALVRERTIPTERPPLVGEVVSTFVDIGCRVVSATDSHCR
jgi:hypothetical protein